jgi:hypothetical protein
MAGAAVTVVGGSLASGVGGQMGQKTAESKDRITALRRELAKATTEEVLSGVSEETGDLVKSGVGNLTGGEIAARYGKRTGTSFAKGLGKGLTAHLVAAGKLRAEDPFSSEDEAKKLLTETTEDGRHQLKITKNGLIFLCSWPCLLLETHYEEELKNDPGMRTRIQKLKDLSHADALSEAKKLEAQLRKKRRKAWGNISEEELDDLSQRIFPRKGIDEVAAETSRKFFAEVYQSYLKNGRRPTMPDGGIWDPEYQVMIRPNGDVLGAYTKVLRYIKSAELSGIRRTGKLTVEAHHLMEDWIIEKFKISRNEALCVSLESGDHSIFTGALPKYLYGGRDKFYDIDELYDAHAQMYIDHGHPEWVGDLRNFLRAYRSHIMSQYDSKQIPGSRNKDYEQRVERVRKFMNGL